MRKKKSRQESNDCESAIWVLNDPGGGVINLRVSGGTEAKPERKGLSKKKSGR